MKLGEAMVKDVVTVDHTMKVLDVCKLMGEKRIGSVLVEKEGKVFGIFTERDLVSKVIPRNGLEDEVGKFASTPLITVSPDYSVKEAARIMADMKIRRLVIVNGEKVVGIFTAADLAKVIAESPLDF
jgi:CBS domain-containing protein